ncbi:non-specific lipid-transfer protein 8 [Fagus crenata]
MKSPKFAIPTIAVVMLLLLAPATEASISCSDVVKDLRPCLTYLQNGTGKPTAACCSGVSALASAASSSADKKAACACIKSSAKQINANAEAAKALPGDCGITSHSLFHLTWIVPSAYTTSSGWLKLKQSAVK